MKLRSLHTTKNIEFYTPDFTSELEIPFVSNGISAGFPSPADDFLNINIDLNLKLLFQNLLSFHSQIRTTFNPELGNI